MIISLSKIINFIRIDIWRIRLVDIPRTKAFFIRLLRITFLSLREFKNDKCTLRASALTFYSLLSVVPVVAMAFGISRGFGSDELLEKELLNKFPGQEEVVNQIITFANSLLEETKGGMLAGVGIAVLFWTVIKLLNHIEKSFNDIWEVKTPRKFLKRLSDYLSVTLICPVLVIVASSATVFISTQISLTTEKFIILGIFSPIISFILKFLPYGVIWGVFGFLYLFMPNTKVKIRSAFIAGAIAGSAYQVAQWGYINFQVGVAHNNAIYGSFAALPLFLLWLHISWIIVLFGAEVSFAIQNVYTYEFEPDCLNVSNAFRKLVALCVVHLLVKNFSKGFKPLTAINIAATLGAPPRLISEIIDELVSSRVLSEISLDKSNAFAYQPACDINCLTIKYIVEALEHKGEDNVPISQTDEFKTLSEALKAFGDTIEKSSANKLLRDI